VNQRPRKLTEAQAWRAIAESNGFGLCGRLTRLIDNDLIGDELERRDVQRRIREVARMSLSLSVIDPAEPIPGPWSIDDAVYYADHSRVSHSMLEVFRRSVEQYAARFVTHTIPEPEPTAAMNLGSVTHIAIFEPDEWHQRVAVAPEINRRTNAGKQEWAEFVQGAGDRLIVDLGEALLIQGMVAGVRRNSLAQAALNAAGRCEQAIRWIDRATGLPMKGKADKIAGELGLLLDLKTTGDVSPGDWARSVANWGYHRQAALYMQGASDALDFHGEFVHLVVSKTPPHECVLYALDAPALELGRLENQRLLDELAERSDLGDWSGRWEGRVCPLSLPKWAFTQSEASHV